MKRRDVLAFGLGAGAGFAIVPRAARAADQVTVGMLRSPTALFVGIDRGYFSAEGIDVTPAFVASESELVPELAAGTIDVGTTPSGAALFNAFARGVNATIVADYWAAGTDVPSSDAAYIMLRKDLAAEGAFKQRDATGLTLAIPAKGEMAQLIADTYLASVKLSPNELNIVEMPLPDMVPALVNHAIDIAVTVDPYATKLAADGVAVKAASLASLMPGSVQAVIVYGQRLGKSDRGLGLRFLRAFAQANRYLRAQLATPAGRAAIAQIYQRYVPIDDPALYTKIGLAVAPEKLTVDVDGKYALRWQMQQYVKAGQVEKAPDLKAAVDNAFTEALARPSSVSAKARHGS